MENFNLKKFLVENKLTTNSKMLTENNNIDDIVDDIVDWASSGQGSVSGLEYGVEKLIPQVGVLSSQERQELVQKLNDVIEHGEGWTEEDIYILRDKLNLDVEIPEDFDDEYDDEDYHNDIDENTDEDK